MLPNGLLVAESYADLTDGTDLINAINVDEFGAAAGGGLAWSNVARNGTRVSAAGGNCVSWTSSSSGNTGKTGDVSSLTDQLWTERNITEPCNVSRKLYCFQQ